MLLGLVSVPSTSVKVDLDSGEALIVSVPDGFKPLGGSSPEFREYETRLTPKGQRFLETFLTPKDLEAVASGFSESREREFEIAVLEPDSSVTPIESRFAGIKTRIQKMDQASYEAAYANANPQIKAIMAAKGVSNGVSGVHTPQFYGVVANGPREIGYAYGLYVDKGGASTNGAVAKVYVYAKGHIFVLKVTSSLNSGGDLEWLKKQAAEWADAVVRANPG
jgi:hypothetical protein